MKHLLKYLPVVLLILGCAPQPSFESTNSDGDIISASDVGKPMTAYWLSDMDPATVVLYDPLLVVINKSWEEIGFEADLQRDSATKSSASHILDQPAIFLETHERDSIWNSDGNPIKPFVGKLAMDKTGEIIADGRRYSVTNAETIDVIKLLENPEGNKRLHQLHRLHGPIAGAEQTAKAIILLLRDQAIEKQANQ